MKSFKPLRFVWVRVSNIIYTSPGIRRGFTFKELCVTLVLFNRLRHLRIPFWILGYDKKQAIEIYEMYQKLRQHLQEEENAEL